MSIQNLPDDVIEIILTNFELFQTKFISKTCKRFHNIVDSIFWKQKTLNAFPHSTSPITTIVTWQQQYLIHLECQQHYNIKNKYHLTTAKVIIAFDRGSMRTIMCAAGVTIIWNFLTIFSLKKLFNLQSQTKFSSAVLSLAGSLINQYILIKYDLQIFTTFYTLSHKASYYKTVLSHVSSFSKKWNKVLPFIQVMIFGKYCFQN